MPVVKKLTRHGNSRALVLDKSTMDLLGIESWVSITTDGSKLIIEPAAPEQIAVHTERVEAALDKGNKKYGRMLKGLADGRPKA